MKSSNLFLIGGLSLAALWFFKDNITSLLSPGSAGGSSYSAPLNTSPSNIQAKDITDASTTQIKTIPRTTGQVKDASSSVLKAIDVQAKADTSKVVYYPDYGIVTKRGQGFSTAYPEKYVNTKAADLKQSYSAPQQTGAALLKTTYGIK